MHQVYNILILQVNSVTAWIDGSSIYGTSHSWSDALRSFSGGKLAAGPDGLFPPYAKKTLPVFRVPDPSTGKGGDEGIYSKCLNCSLLQNRILDILTLTYQRDVWSL